jgi:undecaprenyl diphosphate synthase
MISDTAFYDRLKDLVMPQSVAIILDGNGRWAKKRNLPRELGHKAGCDTLEEIIDYASQIGIKYLTVYAFSTENWKRSKEEIDALFRLFKLYVPIIIDNAHKNNSRCLIIGDLSRFSKEMQDTCNMLMDETKNGTNMTFTMALNYGGRDEIIRAVKKIVKDKISGKINNIDSIDEKLFSGYLDTAKIPDPDLLIRTSGEMRLSNFLPWQLAYTEFYMPDTLWPDFHKEELVKAIEDYNNRDRRFGARKE